MEPLLAYLLKSTICISILYLVFRWTLKKETLFALSRYILLAILLVSLAIPIIKLPELFPQTIDIKVLPEQRFHVMPNMEDVAVQITTIPTRQQTSVSTERSISVEQISTIVYAIGVLILFISLLIALAKIGTLLLRSKVYKKGNYNIALIDGAFSPMSFGKFIIMSKQDYKDHRKEILKHELAHIQFKHTYDLILVELIKLFHWFNPLVYQLRNDLKEIQEFQVDQHLIQSGINSKEYQLLLIKKCVGAERYALANSFNHCQIKNRIVMMNNSNNSKGKSWKVAIFLPVAALMLMAFGNNRSELPPKSLTPEFLGIAQEKKIWTENDFEKLDEAEAKKQREKDFFENKTWHSVLINKDSKIMMDDKRIDMNDVVINMKELFTKAMPSIKANLSVETKSALPFTIYIRKDIATDANLYNQLLNTVANSFLGAREDVAQLKFSKSYNALSNEDRNVIDNMIPMNIKITVPKQMGAKTATEVPSIRIDITPKGIYLENELASLEEMKSKISKQVAEKPETVISVRVGIGASDKQVNEVKSALREARALHINYSTDVKEKKPIGKIQPPPIVIDIKANGIYCKNELVDLDRLKEIITPNVAMNPNQIVTLNVAPEVKMGEVTAVKEVLREAGALNFKYSTDVREKDYLNMKGETSPIYIKVKKEGLFIDKNETTIDQLKKLVKSSTPIDSTIVFFLEIDEGVTQSSINEVKLALKDAKHVKPLIKTISTTSFVQKTATSSVKKSNKIVVFVDRNEITVNGKKVPLKELASEMDKHVASNIPQPSIIVNTTTQTSNNTFLAVKEQLKDCKIPTSYYQVSQ